MIDGLTYVGRAVGRAVSVVVSIAKDVLWLPVATLCMMGWKADGHPDSDTVKGRPAIILLHGSGSSPGSMYAVRKNIEKDYYGSVFVPAYDQPWGGAADATIASLTDGLVIQMERICKQTDQRKVVFVGHSLGGLLAADYADRWAESQGVTVLGIVSICTPWHGTTRLSDGWSKMVSAMVGPPARHNDMRPDSDFVQRIRASSKIPQIRTIGTTTDILVPVECARAPTDKECHMTIHGIGHYSAVVDQSAILFVRSCVCDWVG